MQLWKTKVYDNGALLRHRVADLCISILKWLLCLLLISLLLMNLFCFSNLIDNTEVVEYIIGPSVWKILFCIGIVVGGYTLYHSSFIERINLKKLETGLIIFVVIVSVIWIFMAYDTPKHDPYYILEAAENFANNDYSALNANSRYLQRYPFQLPFVFCVEQIYKIIGPERYLFLRLLNVCYIVGIYKYIIKISYLILPGEQEKKLVTLFLYGYWPPIFLTTFIYALIPSAFLSLVAVHEFLAYYATNSKRNLVYSGIFLGVSICLKSNVWIGWIAFGIVSLLAIAKGGPKQTVWVLLISAAIAIFGQQAITVHYENRSGYSIQSGTPNVLWLAMGLQDGDRAPGWYNSFPYNTLKSVDFDTEKAADIGRSAVKASVNEFFEQPTAAIKFFVKKELSQWCEPSYECFNLSYHREHEKPLGNLARSIYIGTIHELLLFWFHSFQIMSILGLLIYCLNLKKSSMKIEHLVVLLTILGGFLFHTFWEGKSQYIFPYYTMMIPFSINGLATLFLSIRGGTK